MKAVGKFPVRRFFGAMSVGAFVVTGFAWATVPSKAAPGLGCETIAAPGLLNWGQKRTICDTPRRADGSWTRSREYWTPAHYVPVSCYRWSCTGGYQVGNTTARYEEYVVFDHNVLPDEPGWLPTGSVVIR
ncbi:CDGP domain-containing protein [Mycolicibacterium fortuitum]|uniref:CDGP domain-containing protein n=1 Tax=Mycolicibacterium fortuitum TaxID=1766 RepID=UPI001AF0119B|nr:hypothetical protein [Mycolicibacterium fortuitum]MBP3086988.1 hypothetical protein [Mycolicibacterium fortuitum]